MNKLLAIAAGLAASGLIISGVAYGVVAAGPTVTAECSDVVMRVQLGVAQGEAGLAPRTGVSAAGLETPRRPAAFERADVALREPLLEAWATIVDNPGCFEQDEVRTARTSAARWSELTRDE